VHDLNDDLLAVLFLSAVVTAFVLLLFKRMEFYSAVSLFLEESHLKITGGFLERL